MLVCHRGSGLHMSVREIFQLYHKLTCLLSKLVFLIKESINRTNFGILNNVPSLPFHLL